MTGLITLQPLLPTKPDLKHLGPFIVGLIDGDGSLQVNHWRKKNLQFRLVVKLSNKPLNLNILNGICFHSGGYVKQLSNNILLWVVNDQKKLKTQILPLLITYPPLTTRVHLQLEFFLECLNHQSVNLYLSTRHSKFDTRSSITPLFTELPYYFSSWLSGFIEAEGCWARRSGTIGFSFRIGQKFDLYLILAILKYFKQDHLIVQKQKESFYFVEIGNRLGIEIIVNHCINYPLLGYKYYQLATAIKKSNYFSSYSIHFWKN